MERGSISARRAAIVGIVSAFVTVATLAWAATDGGTASKVDAEKKTPATTQPDGSRPPKVTATKPPDRTAPADGGKTSAKSESSDPEGVDFAKAPDKTEDGGGGTAAARTTAPDRDGGGSPAPKDDDDGGAKAAAAVAKGGHSSRRSARSRVKAKVKKLRRRLEKAKVKAAIAKKKAEKSNKSNYLTELAAKKALKALQEVREQEEAAVRRLNRVESYLNQGNVTAAMKELKRARSAAIKGKEAAETFAEQEVLTPVDYVVRSLLSLGILILFVVLIWLSAMALRRLMATILGTEEDGTLKGSLVIRLSYKLFVFVIGVGLAFGAAYVAVRHIWRLRVTAGEIFGALEHPLFAFEGRPVTFVSIVFFLVSLALVVVFSRRIRLFFQQRLMPRFTKDVGMQQAFATMLYYLVVFIGLMVSLEVLGVGAKTVAIVAGVVGLGIGFGMQHIINNFLSGFLLFFERPIRVGDIVDVGTTNNVEGKVVAIHGRATTIVTRDHVTIVVPNSEFIQGKVTNLSVPDGRMRYRIKFGVAYEANPQKVKEVLLAAAAGHSLVLREPKPQVNFIEYADSAIVFELAIWITEILHRSRIASELRYDVFERFAEAKITIPFPQRDTNLKPTPELARLLGQLRDQDE